MAKHDQRILKFLNQNADRAPTITEMMTRLNISISDISDSLQSLQSQGLISKKTNSQGIECWYPTSSSVAATATTNMQPQMDTRMIPQMAMASSAQMPGPIASNPMMGELRHTDSRVGMDPRFMADRAMAPEPQPPMPKAPPVQVQHIPMAEPMRPAPIPEPAFNGAGFNLAPAPKSVSMMTFVLGLIVAIALSTWLGIRMADKEIAKASKNFVDRKALTDATAAFTDFQDKTKAHVTALEDEVKKLTADLAAAKPNVDSQKNVAAAKPEAKPEAKADAKSAKADAKEAKAEAKAAKLAAAKAKAAAKAAKAKKVAKARAASSNNSANSAIAKAAARGAAMRHKSTADAPPASDDASSSSSSSASSSDASASSSPSESAPSVPDPPGIDNQELPPPPSE